MGSLDHLISRYLLHVLIVEHDIEGFTTLIGERSFVAIRACLSPIHSPDDATVASFQVLIRVVLLESHDLQTDVAHRCVCHSPLRISSENVWGIRRAISSGMLGNCSQYESGCSSKRSTCRPARI